MGLALRKLRISKNYSQQFVADYLKISRVAYIKWENEKTKVSFYKLEQLGQLYQMSLADLILKIETIDSK